LNLLLNIMFMKGI